MGVTSGSQQFRERLSLGEEGHVQSPTASPEVPSSKGLRLQEASEPVVPPAGVLRHIPAPETRSPSLGGLGWEFGP